MQDNLFNAYYSPSYYNDERLFTYTSTFGATAVCKYKSNNTGMFYDYERSCKMYVKMDGNKFIRNTYGEKIETERLVNYHKSMDNIRKLRGTFNLILLSCKHVDISFDEFLRLFYLYNATVKEDMNMKVLVGYKGRVSYDGPVILSNGITRCFDIMKDIINEDKEGL